MYKKNAIALQNLAKELIKLNPRDKVKTIKYYSGEFSISVGTVSKAFKEIEELGGARFEKKGHLGTFVIEINYEILYKLTGSGSLICVMPLPYLKRYEGLASGIKSCLKDQLYFAYMRGGDTRIKFLEAGSYQSAIMSKRSAMEFIKEGKNIEIAFEFGKRTYIGKHVIVHRGVPIKKVGVDSSSKDHLLLSSLNFQNNEDCKFVDLNYSEILDSLVVGDIDGAIWNLDNMKERKSSLPYMEMPNNLGENDFTEAVIVIRKGEEWIKNYLHKILDKKAILKHQKSVIDGEIYPSY